MGQVIVRGLEDEAIERLKVRAKANGRSLESELRLILMRESAKSAVDRREIARKARERLGRYKLLDSVELLREDRSR